MGDELKHCPFCGAPAFSWEWNGGARVDCSGWDSKDGQEHFVGVGGKTIKEAIERWNMRADINPTTMKSVDEPERRKRVFYPNNNDYEV